jgi:peptidoglycan/xylan/chitin deacetylase (PgdA/CDA1 family)
MRLNGYLIDQLVEKLDNICSGIQLRFGELRGGLITLFVHNLFLDATEIGRNLAYPQQCLTVGHLEQTIKYFQSVGYRFVSPTEILAGLDPRGKHVLLTFDDGYFNNLRALPLMEAHGVPGLFFVPAGMIQDGKAHWWDEVYRTGLREGRSLADVLSEIQHQTWRRTNDIEDEFLKKLGLREFRAVSDIDRLFTPHELREFAAHPLVFIGNHGSFHEFLPAYPVQEASRAISQAQQIILEITGKPSLAIAYPVGAYSSQVLKVTRDAGLCLGFGTEARKEYVGKSFQGDRALRLGRHTLEGANQESIESQCARMRSDVGLHTRYRVFLENLKSKLGRTQNQ